MPFDSILSPRTDVDSGVQPDEKPAFFRDLNLDQTVEAVRHRNGRAFGFQWHPEGEPGPYDTGFLFDEFLKLREK